MTETFTPPEPPTINGLARQVQTRTLTAPFGDGYTQRGADGLNAIERTVSLSWPALDVADADTIETFFEARGGWQAFFWTAPREATPRKWIAQTWTRDFSLGTLDAIQVTFQEVFDL